MNRGAYVTTGYTTRPASKPVDLVHNHATQLTRLKPTVNYNGNIAEHRSKTKLRSMCARGALQLHIVSLQESIIIAVL